MPGVIAGERRAELRYAALPSIEGLARLQRACRRLADEGRGWKVALAGPERDQPLASAAVVEDFHDARIRRFPRLASEREKEIVVHPMGSVTQLRASGKRASAA